MDALEQRIAIAQRQVDNVRRRVERQRYLIKGGQGSQDSKELLARFERSLQMFEDDLARYLKEKASREARLGPGPR